jgi:Helix-turn-helix family
MTVPELDVVARAHRATEPLHAMIYFAPEAEQELTGVGLRPGRMGYFASRSAAMGAVSPGVVTATFYNFNSNLVARHIPRAWTLASPEAVLGARTAAADKALHRLLGPAADPREVDELAGLAAAGCAALTPEARPLYAAHAGLDWPDEPRLRLWHACTLLREYRGDGHLMALQRAGLSGIEAIVTHTATGRGFTLESAKKLRGWSEEEWATATERLTERGLWRADGLTTAGTELRNQVEAETDELDTAAWRHLGADRTARLIELGKGLSRQIAANGAFPAGVFAAR